MPAPDGHPLLRLDRLSKRFGGRLAVEALTLEVAPGEVYGLIGPNGSGKTTTVKLIARLYRPTAGQVLIAGIDLGAEPERAKGLLGYIPDEPFAYEKMTGREFLGLVAALYRVAEPKRSRRIEELLDLYSLGAEADEYVENYSRGNRQKLAILVSLLHAPRLLVVDEPIVGLDPESAIKTLDLLRRFAKRGRRCPWPTSSGSGRRRRSCSQREARVLEVHRTPVAGVIGRRLFAATLPIVTEGPGIAARPGARPVALALYSAILFVAPLADALEHPEAVARLFFLDLLAVGYFVTAFGIRFVFPSLSLEGRGAWILFAAPLSLGRLFLGKLLAYSTILGLAVGPIAPGGALRLVTFPALLGVFGLLLALLIVTTVTVSLGFGVLWPNFREANAERLATSGGGLATIVLCLGYVAAVGWLGGQCVRSFLAGGSILAYLAAAVALSAAIVGGATATARRRFRTLEIL